jgi:hypothetical protein
MSGFEPGKAERARKRINEGIAYGTGTVSVKSWILTTCIYGTDQYSAKVLCIVPDTVQYSISC